MPFMRSLVALSAAVALVCCYSPSVADAACNAICSSTEVYGFTPGGASNCLCSGSISTTSCNCGGQCYTKQPDGRIFLFGYGTNGKCQWDAPDCGNCDESGSTSGSTGTTKTPLPTTGSPTSNSSSGTGTGTNSAGSSAGSNSKTPTAGSDSSSSSSEGMQTWQIALIICCAVLVFIVAVVALLSCYCKARRRLVESEDQEEDSTYYQQQPYSGANGANGTGFMVASTSSTNLSGGGGADVYDSRRSGYNMKAPQGSYVSNEGRYMMAVNSNGSTSVGSADSPDRGAAYTRPSSGSVGEMATTPYASHDRGRGSSMHSQAVTL